MKKICVVVTVSSFIKNFMLDDLKLLSQYFEITIITSDSINFKDKFGLNCITEQVHISRKIQLFKDLNAFFWLFHFFYKQSFDIVLSATPKAGLLAMLAAFLTKTPKRVHFFSGQVWANKLGFKKFLLKFIDKFIATIATDILVAGKSQREFLIKQKIIFKHKSKTLFHGVDIDKFKADKSLKEQLKNKYELTDSAVVFMFLGRINKDKGVAELLEVMAELLAENLMLNFFLVGDDEGDIDKNTLLKFAKLDRVFVLKEVKHPEKILNLADVLVLPSHREGCAQSPFEAAAMGIPTIASNIYGLADSVLDKQTGLTHLVKDKDDMKNKYISLFDDKLRHKLGKNAHHFVINNFDKINMSDKFVKFFLEL
jgi:glycosyltransferase involved in cell wall biosynthesis